MTSRREDRSRAPGANPELVTAYRVRRMLKLALCVAYGAAQRTESRGAHFREDHPRRDDAQWLKRTLATWGHDTDQLPSLAYEPLDVRGMELPPGWRGYGAKDYVDHAEDHDEVRNFLANAHFFQGGNVYKRRSPHVIAPWIRFTGRDNIESKLTLRRFDTSIRFTRRDADLILGLTCNNRPLRYLFDSLLKNPY